MLKEMFCFISQLVHSDIISGSGPANTQTLGQTEVRSYRYFKSLILGFHNSVYLQWTQILQ